jgi:uncharacterized membrane protein YeaQ/YmgE (transglycosylase-associated protein family)
MRRRLYFLLPGVARTRQVFNELLLARIDDRHIHVLARDGTALGDLPEATFVQKSDTVHGTMFGMFWGGATGAVAGILAVLFPPTGIPVGLGIILATGLIGSLLGGWAAGVVGTDVPNTRLKGFESAIAGGQLLSPISRRFRNATGSRSNPRPAHAGRFLMCRDARIPAVQPRSRVALDSHIPVHRRPRRDLHGRREVEQRTTAWTQEVGRRRR